MRKDGYGFWHSVGMEITLDSRIQCRKFYRKGWAESPQERGKGTKEIVHIRECVNQYGLSVIIASMYKGNPLPSIVICLGGPITPIPNIYEEGSIYQTLMNNGFAIIIPLRRGVMGISPGWEDALKQHYGEYDIKDTIEATTVAITFHPEIIDKNRIYLYGGSYGGYVAELIAGKGNFDRLFRAIIAHCGVYDLASYPWHNQGNPKETMQTYGNTTDQEEYSRNVAEISPKSYVSNWDVPVLLIHHLSDMSSWFGQSVTAYNDALKREKQVSLILLPGPHTYEIKHRNKLFQHIVSFFKSN